MTGEYFVPAVLTLWLVYVGLRFGLLEILTVVLRRVPPAQAWFKRQTAKGLFAREVRSPALFSASLQGMGSLIDWIVGRGWLRALTFVFIAAITIFLAMLPMDRVAAGRAQYDAAYAAVRDAGSVQELAQAACVAENGLAVVRQRTGVSILPPEGFRPYPIDRSQATWRAVGAKRSEFLLYALMSGRVLTDDPAAVMGGARSHPAVAAFLDRNTKDGHLTGEAYTLLRSSPESEALAAEIIALCDNDPTTRSHSVTPVRELALYPGLIGRARARILTFLEAPSVRDAYDSLQVQVATSQLGLSFFVALAAAGVLWLSAKIAITITRLSLRKTWLIVSYGVVVGLSATAFVAMGQLVVLAQTAVNTVAPVAIGLALAAAPGPGIEADYRRQANAAMAEGLKMIEPTCIEIGPASPLTDYCRSFDIMAEPWDPVTQTFDFDRVLSRPSPNDDDTSKAVMRTLTQSLLTFIILQTGVDQTRQNSADITLWKGVRTGNLLIFVTLPLLLTAGFATLLAPLLELRWTIVKRIDRIVR